MTPSARIAPSHSVPLWPTLAVALALAAALALRFYVVEPRDIGFACQAAVPPWWCDIRRALVLTFQWGGLGGLALALGVLGFINRARGAAIAALVLGVLALTLYNPETGAVGFLLGMLRTLRD